MTPKFATEGKREEESVGDLLGTRPIQNPNLFTFHWPELITWLHLDIWSLEIKSFVCQGEKGNVWGEHTTVLCESPLLSWS